MALLTTDTLTMALLTMALLTMATRTGARLRGGCGARQQREAGTPLLPGYHPHDNCVRQAVPCYLVITPMTTARGRPQHVTWLSPRLQVASEPYAYYATRNLQPGDEVTSPLP